MNKNSPFVPCEDSFGEDANRFSCSYKTVDEAKEAILKDLHK